MSHTIRSRPHWGEVLTLPDRKPHHNTMDYSACICCSQKKTREWEGQKRQMKPSDRRRFEMI